MADKYLPQQFEKKWVEKWEKDKIYQVPGVVDRKKKFYTLVEFPYPSGAGLHVGHARSWSAMDAYSRKKRMQGFQVLYPMGWDAFGLPAENYAIKMKIHPSITVAENIAKFKKQCQSLGFSFDWSREINTSDPEYYKWTQWIFIQLFKKKLAYQAEVPVNWCPFCKTNLADEEVLSDGTHERCGNKTEKRPQRQWLLRITKYANRLLEDLKTVDYSERIARQQVNWIGRSEGVLIEFRIQNSEFKIKVFTTALDTIFGVTFMVLAPEHPLVKKLTTQNNKDSVEKYIKLAKTKGEIERASLDKNKTGVITGAYCINPLNDQKIPIWVADYVLMNYGTGAVMGVPGHDSRDHEFARKYQLEIKPVIKPVGNNKTESDGFWDYGEIKTQYHDKSVLFNSDNYNGLTSTQAKQQMEEYIEKKNIGRRTTTFHLRDWIFSRQHYWGEPIPMVYCEKCKWQPIPESELPLKLPYVKSYEPTETGESPLIKVKDFVKTKCPHCGGEARRETDTMPNWAGSNWYFIRYLDNKNKKEIAGREKMDCWLPVDIYQGGFEHTTLHLLYSRFIYKFLYDIGVVPTKEPYAKRRSHGIILGNDNRKMSKSFGNVTNPDEIVKEYGADTLRIYEMFIGPFDQMVVWSDGAVAGVYRFLRRVWEIYQKYNLKVKTKEDSQLAIKLNKTIKKVTEDIDNLKFNTAVAAMMEFLNDFEKNPQGLSKENTKKFLQILAPFAPFMTEEIWYDVFGEKESIHLSSWSEAEKVTDETITIPIQINGKLRETIIVRSEKLGVKEKIIQVALKNERVKKYLEGKKYKVIYVAGKILNFVT